MFTGLIQDIGTLRSLEAKAAGALLQIGTSLETDDFALGESIAVQGACLTVTQIGPGHFAADCSPETLRRTTLGELRAGDRLHLERALRLNDRLGGHLVSGHVDGTGQVTSVSPQGNSLVLTITPPPSLLRYLIEKGSITVDGVSLTINTLASHHFELALIPHTRQETTLDKRRPGDRVNLEVDLIGKYIERLLQPWQASQQRLSSSNIDEDFLKKHGFF